MKYTVFCFKELPMTTTVNKLTNIERNNAIIRCNLIGIGMNLLLSISKMIIGYFSHSHAVILDGVNSLSDLVSAVFSVVGVRLGMKSADKNHPFGYGRVEYLSSLFITMLILYIGIRTIIDSVDAIFHPHDAPIYSPLLITIMIVSLVAKLIYGLMLRKEGKRLDSAALYMTGTESLGDSLIAIAVLASFLIYKYTGQDIEHYLCIVISLMIIGTGFQMIRDCMTKIIGVSADPALRKKLIQTIVSLPGVLNVSSLVLHSYGEGILIGSLNIEVEQSMTALQITRLSHMITEKTAELGVTITSVGITGTDTTSPEAVEMWDTIIRMVMKHTSIQRVHSFSVDFIQHEIYFSVVRKHSNNKDDLKELQKELENKYPGMKITITESQEPIGS